MVTTQKRPRRLVARLSILVVLAAIITGPATLPVARSEAATNAATWGQDGKFTTDSAVTVRWDNVGNSPENTVPRELGTPIPHTDGKTYGDLPPLVRNQVRTKLGPDNGRGGLSVTVGQTKNLTGQSVSLSFDGVPDQDTAFPDEKFRVFQCWGAPGADGLPDPQAASPDLTTCEMGSVGYGRLYDEGNNARTVPAFPKSGDSSLLAGGDWDKSGLLKSGYLPIRGVDGKLYSGNGLDSGAISQSTTNEITRVQLGNTGHAEAPFLMHTSIDAPFLGCGKREDAPSQSACWLVILPQIGPLSQVNATADVPDPRKWANRLQVKLDFTDIPKPCSSTQQRLISAGSETLSAAVSSWIPALCGQGQGLAVSKVSDGTVRTRQVNGQPLIFTTGGVPESQAAPIASAGVVISYKIGLTNHVGGQYFYGGPVPQVKLNARLIAKILTLSYKNSYPIHGQPANFVSPHSLRLDPEFLALNPDFAAPSDSPQYVQGYPDQNLNLEGMSSDASRLLWTWVVQDPDARAFLNGCPDPHGMVVQPFYSTRSYVGCEGQSQQLEATASAQRASVTNPPGYVDVVPSYPSDSASYPLISWANGDPDWVYDGINPKIDPVTGQKIPRSLPRTFTDAFPRLNDMEATGLQTARMIHQSNLIWCGKEDFCVPPDYPALGKFVPGDTALPKYLTDGLFGITDTATAARYQLQTATLCNTDGSKCVGANQGTLAKAAESFTQDPAPQPDPIKALNNGGYPLTLPIYASMKRSATTTNDTVTQISKVVRYMTGAGQTPGTGVGQLPPGYAPLTKAMQSTADCAVARFAQEKRPDCGVVPPAVVPSGSPSTKPAANGPNPPGTVTGPVQRGPVLPPVNNPQVAGASPAGGGDGPVAGDTPVNRDVPAVDEPTTPPAGAGNPPAGAAPVAADAVAAPPGKTAATESAWGTYGLFILLGVGLVAGIVSPLLRSFRKGSGQ